MKNKSTKIFVLTLAAALVLCASFAFASNAETETTPEIISQNVNYTDKFSLMYAVDASTVAGGAVTLRVYEEYPTEASDAIMTETSNVTELVTPSGKSPVSCYVFVTPGVGAGDFTKQFYVTATDEAGNVSDVYRYSVAEYLNERLYKNGIASVTEGSDGVRRDFYLSTLAFGANAEKLLYNLDEDNGNDREYLVTDYCYVYSDLGTVDGKFTSGVYTPGTELTFAPADTSKKYQATAVSDGKGTIIADNGKFILNSTSYIDFKVYERGEGKFYNMGSAIQNATSGTVRILNFNSTASPLVTNPASGKLDSSIIDGASCHSLLTAYESHIRVDNTNTNNLASSDYITVSEFDMKFSGFKVPSNLTKYFFNLRLYDGNGESHYVYMEKNDDGTFSLGEANTAKIKADEWFNVRLEISYNDDNSANVDIYINNEYATTLQLAGFEKGCFKTWITIKSAMYDSTEGAEQGKVFVDNMFFGMIEPTYKTVEK